MALQTWGKMPGHRVTPTWAELLPKVHELASQDVVALQTAGNATASQEQSPAPLAPAANASDSGNSESGRSPAAAESGSKPEELTDEMYTRNLNTAEGLIRQASAELIASSAHYKEPLHVLVDRALAMTKDILPASFGAEIQKRYTSIMMDRAQAFGKEEAVGRLLLELRGQLVQDPLQAAMYVLRSPAPATIFAAQGVD